MTMNAEEFSGLSLEEFNDLIDSFVDESLDKIEKGELPKPKDVDIEVIKQTKALSTSIEKGEDEMVLSTEPKEDKEHPQTHDENGNPIIIGHCRKSVVIITDQDGKEIHYGSSVVASEWLDVSPATVRSRCRRDEFVDEEGRIWEEVPLSEYKENYE